MDEIEKARLLIDYLSKLSSLYEYYPTELINQGISATTKEIEKILIG